MLLAVEDEGGAPGQDDVELLVAEPLFRVLLDDVLARFGRRVGVDAERRDPEMFPQRRPAQRAWARQRLDPRQARDLVTAQLFLLQLVQHDRVDRILAVDRSSRVLDAAQSSSRS